MSANDQTERRKLLNRLAAQKLRNRQKEKAVTAKQDYFSAQSRNTQLIYEVKQLRRRKQELQLQLESHLMTCYKSIKSATPIHSTKIPVSAASVTTETITDDIASVLAASSSSLQPVFVLRGDRYFQLINLNNVQLESEPNSLSIDDGVVNAADSSDPQSESVSASTADAENKFHIFSAETGDDVTPTLMMEVEQQPSTGDNAANDETGSDQGSIVIAMDNDEEQDSEQPVKQTETVNIALPGTASENSLPEPALADDVDTFGGMNDNSAVQDTATLAVVSSGSENVPKAISPSKLKPKSEKTSRRVTKKKQAAAVTSVSQDCAATNDSPDCNLPVSVSSLIDDE